MKLILIPDNPVCRFGVANRPKVAISIPGDDHTIHDILEKLVTPALVATSFHPQTIQDGYREARVMGAQDEEELRDDLTEWSTPAALPPLPPVPDGFESWTEPELVPRSVQPCYGTMGFFHDEPGNRDTEWHVSTGGSYGGATDYPIYFIKALEA